MIWYVPFVGINLPSFSASGCHTYEEFKTSWNVAYYSKVSWTKCLPLNPFCSVFLGHVFYFTLTYYRPVSKTQLQCWGDTHTHKRS